MGLWRLNAFCGESDVSIEYASLRDVDTPCRCQIVDVIFSTKPVFRSERVVWLALERLCADKKYVACIIQLLRFLNVAIGS
jgi:hypothetical protein